MIIQGKKKELSYNWDSVLKKKNVVQKHNKKTSVRALE